MVEHTDGTAGVTLSAGMAGCVEDLIADTAKSGPAAIQQPLSTNLNSKRSARRHA
jgi:hypothetical protein